MTDGHFSRAERREETEQFEQACRLIQYKENDRLEQLLADYPALVKEIDSSGDNLLIKAVQLDNNDAVSQLLERSKRIRTKQSKKLLYHAIVNMNSYIFASLLENGANINVTFAGGDTPLLFALNRNCEDILKIIYDYIVTYEPNVKRIILEYQIPSELALNVLNKLIILKNEELLREMLEIDKFKKFINETNKNDDKLAKTPLIYACENNCDISLVELLLDKGARIEELGLGLYGRDPFHIVARSNNLGIIDLFLKRGYRLHSFNFITERIHKLYPNVIFELICSGNVDENLIISMVNTASEQMLKHTDKYANTILHLAANRKYYRLFVNLLRKPVNVYKMNAYGQTAENILLKNIDQSKVATAFNPYIDSYFVDQNAELIKRKIRLNEPVEYLDVCKLIENERNILLLKKMLDKYPEYITKKDNHGNTLLMTASRAGNYLGVCLLLLYKECSIKEKNTDDESALYFSIVSGKEDIFQVLLSYGAILDANTIPKMSSLPLTEGTSKERKKICKRILKHTIPSTLINAVTSKCEGMLKELFKFEEYKNRINEKDEYAKTLLILACENGCSVSIIKILLDNRASIYEHDQIARDAFFVAAEFGNLEIINTFIEHGYIFNINNLICWGNEHPNAIFAALKAKHVDKNLIFTLIKAAPPELFTHADLEGNTIFHVTTCMLNKKQVKGTFFISSPQKEIHKSKRKIVMGSTIIQIFVYLLYKYSELDQKSAEYAENILYELCVNMDNQIIDNIANRVRRQIQSKAPVIYSDVCELIKNGKHVILLKRVLDENPRFITDKDGNGENLLMRAVQSGNYYAVCLLLLYTNCHINETNKNGFSALYFAIAKKELNTIDLLLEHKADINMWENEQSAPLFAILKYGNRDVIDLLLQHNLNLKIPTNMLYRILQKSIQFGFDHLFELLTQLQNFADCITKKDKSGKTLLMDACETKHFDVTIVEKLLNKGASMYEKDKHGRDIIYKFIHNHLNGRLIIDSHQLERIVELFFKHNYQIEDTNFINEPEGVLPVILKILTNMSLQMINILSLQINKQDLEGNTILHMVAPLTCDYEGYERKKLSTLFYALMISNIDINITNSAGKTIKDLLDPGFDLKIYDILENINHRINNDIHNIPGNLFNHLCELLKFGIDYSVWERIFDFYPQLVEYKDPLGESLLIKSVKTGKWNLMRILLRKGSLVDARDNNNYTALFYAIENGDFSQFYHLIESGADVNASGTENETPLTFALKKFKRGIVLHLIDTLKVDLQVPEELQHRLLVYLINSKKNEILKKVLEMDTFVKRINEKDELGKTLLIHLSENVEHKDITPHNLLLNKGASMYALDKQGRDAFLAAVQHGNTIAVTTLLKREYEIKTDLTINSTIFPNCPNPIFVAIKFNHTNVNLITYLVENTPREWLNHVDTDGNSILHLAAEFETDDMFNYLRTTAIDQRLVNLANKTAHMLHSEKRKTNKYKQYISLRVAGYNELFNLINKNEFNNIKKLVLQSKIKVEEDHLHCAIESFDSDIPDLNIPYNGSDADKVRILNLIIENVGDYYNEKATPIACFLDKPKVILALWENLKHRDNLSKWVRWVTPFNDTEISFRMTIFLNTLDKNFNIPVSAIRYSSYKSADEYDKYSSFIKKSFPTFFSNFVKGIENNFKFEEFYDFQFSSTDLEKAIAFRREDIATFLLVHGCRPNIGTECDELVESYFSEDFKILYRKMLLCEGKGLLTLKQSAYNTLRNDKETFHEAWYTNVECRQILKFETNLYQTFLKENNILKDVILKNYFHVLKYLIIDMELTPVEFIDTLFSLSGADYKLFSYIKNNCDDFKLLDTLLDAILKSDFKVLQHIVPQTDIYEPLGKKFDAFIFALTFGDMPTVDLFLRHGGNIDGVTDNVEWFVSKFCTSNEVRARFNVLPMRF